MTWRISKCTNESCRSREIERPVSAGEWFVDDPILCAFCGEPMDTVTQVEDNPFLYPLGPGGWGRGGRWPKRLGPRHR
jgi:hypothetical protein